MARTRSRLSARFVQNIKTPGRHHDGGGLYLQVDDDANRRWVFRYTIDKRQRYMGLGSARDVSLARARELAEEARAAIRAGRDPLEIRGQKAEVARTRTFREVAERYIEDHSATWKNPKHADAWRLTLLEKAAAIGNRPIDAIDTEAVLEVLKPIWLELPETATRLRARIERVLDAAKAAGDRRGENPARWRGHLDHLLPRQKRRKRHHAALPWAEAPAFIAELRRRISISARALEWTILTAARTGETTGATWSEIDLEERIWTLPGERMKGGRDHRVPLSRRCMAILAEMRIFAEARASKEAPLPTLFVFPGAGPGEPLSNMAMAECLKEFELPSPATVHGFRSTFRDWAGDRTRIDREVIEAALAHKFGDDTELAYRRSDALERRRRLMDSWAAFLDADTGAKVVRLR